MKIRILDRILVALAGLLMIAAAAALAAQLFFSKDVIGFVTRLLDDQNTRVFIIIGAALICILGVYCLLLLFRHQGKSGKFITQKTDTGELAISLKALESMVQKCIEPHSEINTQSIHLENQKGSLLIRIRGTVAGGISIPLTVDTLQQQIKQYVTACSGVEVKEIKVLIESSGEDAKDAPFAIAAPQTPALPKGSTDTKETAEQLSGQENKPEEIASAPAAGNEEADRTAIDAAAAAAAAAAALMQEAPQEPDDRPVHQRLFSTVEEPCVMPMPPTPEEKKADEEAEEAAKTDTAADSEDQKKAEEKTDTEAELRDEDHDKQPETEGSTD